MTARHRAATDHGCRLLRWICTSVQIRRSASEISVFIAQICLLTAVFMAVQRMHRLVKVLVFTVCSSDKALLKQWMIVLRHGKKPTQWSYVCSRHFVDADYNIPLSACGSSKNRRLKPNVVPSQNLPLSSHPPRVSNVDRGAALLKRNASHQVHDSLDAPPEFQSNDQDQINETPIQELDSVISVEEHAPKESEEQGSVHPKCSHNLLKNNQLYSVCLMNETQLVHFTGFTRTLFECLYQFVTSMEGFQACRQTSVNRKDQLLLTLIKLRTNMSYQTLGFNFGVSERFVRNVYSLWINAMYDAFKEVDFWGMYEKVDNEYDIIIDCTEIPIQGSGKPDLAQATYSQYKERHTFKALVGVSESGAALYCSDLFGGSTSDRNVVELSGFLDHVKEGQFILADKGFLISDLLEAKGATLNIPPFRESRKKQMTLLQVATTKVIANRRIVVEQIIGKAKNYAILQDVMPNHLWPLANKIFYVVFFFCNLKKKKLFKFVSG